MRNKPFYMDKYRSMVVQDASAEKKAWTTQNDPRVTPIGKFIRKTSIDELPQLVNVLKGDMSLVGPRPERPQFVEQFKEEIPRYMVKHQVRPGLTGLAQIPGRDEREIPEEARSAGEYVAHISLAGDLKCVFDTIGAVVRHDGVVEGGTGTLHHEQGKD